MARAGEGPPADLDGRVVQTVLGRIRAAELGVTLAHEHLLCDLTNWFSPPSEGDPDAPVTLANLHALHRRPLGTTRQNLLLDDEDLAVRELGEFSALGGRSVVDMTIEGIGRDPEALARLSRTAGLHVVMGCGFYVESAHPAYVRELSADDVAALLVGEITDGVGETGVRPGVIGEIGLTGLERGTVGRRKVGPMTGEEEKVLRGAARASLETGLAVSVHIDPIEPRAALPAIDVLEEEGVDPSRIVIDHVDQVEELDYHLAIAARGAYVEYDSLGRDFYSDEWEPGFAWGHDAWRVRFAMRLIEAGHAGQLLFSQDVCLKTELLAYGGRGYAHVLRSIVPTLRHRGVGESTIEQILVENPARAFSAVERN